MATLPDVVVKDPGLPGLTAFISSRMSLPAVRVIVLKGAGDKAFVSGADISQFEKARSSDEANAHYDRISDLASKALADHLKMAQIGGASRRLESRERHHFALRPISVGDTTVNLPRHTSLPRPPGGVRATFSSSSPGGLGERSAIGWQPCRCP